MSNVKQSKNVLLIDDDPGILDAVSALLEYGGYQVSNLSNPAELLTKKEELPDIILLDILLSGIDGRNVCKDLKSNESTRRIPVILLSASKDIELSARHSGADDFLAKPFEMDDLFDKIGKLTA